MIATVGGFTLFLALGVTLYAIAAALLGARQGREDWLASGRNAVLAHFCLVTLAMFLLEYALVTSDFSLRYVVNTSTRASLVRYKIAGLWGSLEGSILLWEWLQALLAVVVVARYGERQSAEGRVLMPYV
ncbi:MAG TPA: hypothetical protein VN203_17240, partial [Candidatus Acidoferrum sp.]|nr:hypothetical protein [Candidatus Acidoferrum sp.]